MEDTATDSNDVVFTMPVHQISNDKLSNGQRVNSAYALQIAMDTINGQPHPWTHNDLHIAHVMLAAMRAQQGVHSADAKVLTGQDDWHATRQLDVWIFG